MCKLGKIKAWSVEQTEEMWENIPTAQICLKQITLFFEVKEFLRLTLNVLEYTNLTFFLDDEENKTKVYEVSFL